MKPEQEGEKKKAKHKGSRRKHRVSSGAKAKRAKRRDAYLARRTKRFGMPFDRMKRRAKRGGKK